MSRFRLKHGMRGVVVLALLLSPTFVPQQTAEEEKDVPKWPKGSKAQSR